MSDANSFSLHLVVKHDRASSATAQRRVSTSNDLGACSLFSHSWSVSSTNCVESLSLLANLHEKNSSRASLQRARARAPIIQSATIGLVIISGLKNVCSLSRRGVGKKKKSGVSELGSEVTLEQRQHTQLGGIPRGAIRRVYTRSL